MRTSREQEKEARTEEICFLLFVWTAPCTALAVAYASSTGKYTNDRRLVAESTWFQRYLDTPLETLAGMMSGEYHGTPGVLHRARKFKTQYDMHAFVKLQNKEKGVAPTLDTVRRHAQILDGSARATPSFNEMQSMPCRQIADGSGKWKK